MDDGGQRLYAVPWTIQRFAGDICWGSCGLGIVGAINLDIGEVQIECIPCRQQTCPHCERQQDDPMGDVHGERVYLRKLKEQ